MDLGLGFGTRIWDLELDLGLTIYEYKCKVLVLDVLQCIFYMFCDAKYFIFKLKIISKMLIGNYLETTAFLTKFQLGAKKLSWWQSRTTTALCRSPYSNRLRPLKPWSEASWKPKILQRKFWEGHDLNILLKTCDN